jgi:hypothetical protein
MYDRTTINNSDMLGGNEVYNVENNSSDFRWCEIIELLDFLERTRESYEKLLDKRLNVTLASVLNSFFTIVIISLVVRINILLIFPCSSISLSVMFYLQFSHKKLMKRIAIERGAANKIVELLNKNLYLTNSLSNLQKVHLSIRLSMFDFQA